MRSTAGATKQFRRNPRHFLFRFFFDWPAPFPENISKFEQLFSEFRSSTGVTSTGLRAAGRAHICLYNLYGQEVEVYAEQNRVKGVTTTALSRVRVAKGVATAHEYQE